MVVYLYNDVTFELLTLFLYLVILNSYVALLKFNKRQFFADFCKTYTGLFKNHFQGDERRHFIFLIYKLKGKKNVSVSKAF